MIDVFVIDNENAIARFIDQDKATITIYENEIRALNAVESSKPSIIIVNYNIHKSATMELVSLLFKASLQSKIVLIAPELSDDEILNYLVIGTKGYLQIDEVEKFINKLIRVITDGEAWISRRMVSKLLTKLHRQKMTLTV
jgi:DNA-binding NarL/FixJ family response regulator